MYTYSFNVKQKPFDNKKIRQAIAYAIDREALATSVTKGGETPAYGYVPYGTTTPSGKDFRDEAPKNTMSLTLQKRNNRWPKV